MFTMYLFKFTQRISLYSYKLYSCIYTLYKYSVYYTTLFFNEPHLLLFNPSRSHRSAANSAAQQIRQHSTLSTTPCGSRNTNRLLSFVSAAACEFLVGRCFFCRAAVNLRDKMKRFRRRPTCRGGDKRLRGQTA